MAKNGSTWCFFGHKRMYLKTIAAESVVGRIWLTKTHFLPFLAKNDRVLPVVATLLSFHPFLAILCSFPVGYSTARTDQHGPQASDFSLNKYQQNFDQVTWRLTTFSHFSFNNFEADPPVCLGDTPSRTTTYK